MRKNKLIAIIKNELKIASKDKLNNFFVYILPAFIVPIIVALFSLTMYSMYKTEQTNEENIKYNIGINFEKDKILNDIIINNTDNFDVDIVNSNEEDLKNKLNEKEIDGYIIKRNNDNKEEYIIYHSDYSLQEDLEYIFKEYKLGKIIENNNISNNELNSIIISEKFVSENNNILEIINMSDVIITLFIIVIFFAIYVMGLSIVAQEKERHTLETLLSFPISEKEVMLGKYLALSIQAIKAVVLCSLSTVLTCFIVKKCISASVLSNYFQTEFPNLLLLLIILLLVGTILAFLFSYLMIFFTSEADNYKKADYQMLYIVIVATLIFVIKDIFDISKLYSAFIPFINLYGIIEQLFSGNINLLYFILTIASSSFFIILLISIFINDINIEKILFGKIESKKQLPNINLKNNDIGIRKTISLLVIGMVIGSILSMAFSFNQILSIISLQLSLLLTFVFGYKICNAKFIKEFSFKKISFLSLISYIMIFIFILITGNLITNMIANHFNIDTSTMDYIIDFIRNYKLLSIVIVALLPAFVEEIVCRGIIQHNFNKKYNIIISILIASMLFGIIHMNLFQFIFTFILGIFLGYVYYDSRNIIIPILFHFINNLLGVILNMYDININTNLGWILLIISFVALFIGLCIISNKILNKRK